MFLKRSAQSKPKNILIISLSNLGDVILTCPVIDIVLNDFPESIIYVMVGPKIATLFEGHPRIKTIVFNKADNLGQRIKWLYHFTRPHYDMVVDLRNTALGFLLPCLYQTEIVKTTHDGHMLYKHQKRLGSVYPGYKPNAPKKAIELCEIKNVALPKEYVLIAPSSADEKKRWSPQGFADLTAHLLGSGENIVFVGNKSDEGLIAFITKGQSRPTVSLAGQTNLRQLAFVISKAKYVIAHDSGAMHLSSYLDVPVVVLWGPTDPYFYGPWSTKSKHAIVHISKNMDAIKTADVIDAIKKIQ